MRAGFVKKILGEVRQVICTTITEDFWQEALQSRNLVIDLTSNGFVIFIDDASLVRMYEQDGVMFFEIHDAKRKQCQEAKVALQKSASRIFWSTINQLLIA